MVHAGLLWTLECGSSQHSNFGPHAGGLQELVRIFFGIYLYSRRGLTVRVKVPALWKYVLKCITLSMILIGKRRENHSGFLLSTSTLAQDPA